MISRKKVVLQKTMDRARMKRAAQALRGGENQGSGERRENTNTGNEILVAKTTTAVEI